MPVTRTARDPNDFSPAASGEEELDESARKRMEVGLSPRRPTAKGAVQRPPDVSTLPIAPWVLSLLLVVVLVVTTLLVVSNITGWAPAWWPARAAGQPGKTSVVVPAAPAGGYRLRLTEEFSSASSTLLQGEQRQEWRTELLPAESVYRVQVWPGHLAWSLLGLDEAADYRLQTSVVVGADAPSGYAGLITRYRDDRHFYLLAVDGEGRFLVQMQDGDEVVTLQPWTEATFLNHAGSSNSLMLEDSGMVLRFYGNGMLLAEIGDLQYAPGHVGLAGGAQAGEVADVRFDWLQLFDAVE
ncbi:MAG: hypothetical protein IT329_23385 [Caldilineaceae bacterium]|nr:hypothetical protein [Caldilineaceae bacterium]